MTLLFFSRWWFKEDPECFPLQAFGLENQEAKELIVEQKNTFWGLCHLWEEVGNPNKNIVWGLFVHLHIISDSQLHT